MKIEKQIIRRDAQNCFVEVLNDSFEINKIHFFFAAYDLNLPSGQRYTNAVSIYMNVPEFLELCRKLTSGELWYLLQNTQDKNCVIYQNIGGTSAEKLTQYGCPRADGKSLSRIMRLIFGKKSDFLLIASNGPGETNSKGLIVPKWGKNPENHVVVSLSWNSLSEILLTTKCHYEAWLSTQYLSSIIVTSTQSQNAII